MLEEFEAIAEDQRNEKPDNLQQPWSFTRAEGDVRCIRHVINLAVQAALTTLKAEPAEETETYRLVYNSATIPLEFQKTDVISAFYKLRRHIYIFRNRRIWRVALENQCRAHTIKYRKPTLDMPIRWNSTYNMIKRACDLQKAIQSVCATQDFDLSVKALEMTQGDWLILYSMLKLFTIFVRPSKKLQGERYPTMNYAIPQYLRLLHKLELLRTHFGANTTLGQACTSASAKLDEYYKMIKKQDFAVVATVCDPRFNFNVFHNLYKDSPHANTHKIRIQKQFAETFAKYQRRERALKAAAVAARIDEVDIDEVAIQLDSDSEADLFQPQGVVNSEAEYTKWMKQQPIAQETDILK